MSVPMTLPGSRSDQSPLLTCDKCKRPREQSGGVFSAGRFMCRTCFQRLNFKTARAPRT